MFLACFLMLGHATDDNTHTVCACVRAAGEMLAFAVVAAYTQSELPYRPYKVKDQIDSR